MLITIGAFDGFHKGHAELLKVCRQHAINDDWGVVTFYPHPSEFMHRLNHALFTLREREFIREVVGIPNYCVLKFDEALKNLTPEKFWALLRERINIDGLVMGSDFHFGCKRSGSAESLKTLAEFQGLTNVHIVDVVNKASYSSSKVREKILAGDITSANEILGYNWFMINSVIHGNERGRTMNFPTANLQLAKTCITPAYGVYSVALLFNHEWHCGALSIGNNPTFHDVNETRAEVHILDFAGDIYGNEIATFFLGRVRDVHTFANKQELINQIELDINECRNIYKEVFNGSRQDSVKFFERAEKVYYSQTKLIPEIITLT